MNNGIQINELEKKEVWQEFSKGEEVDYDRFLRKFSDLVPLSTRREKLVKKAFSSMDKDNSNTITIDDIKHY